MPVLIRPCLRMKKDLAIANAVKQDIETNGYQTLEDLAYTMWSAGRLERGVELLSDLSEHQAG